MTDTEMAHGGHQWFAPTALQPPVNHAQARSWLEPWLRLDIGTEYGDPARALIAYALPRELRPGTLLPVIRRMSWDFYAAQRTKSGLGPDVTFHTMREADIPIVEDALRRLSEALRRYPYRVDALTPTIDIELPPAARSRGSP